MSDDKQDKRYGERTQEVRDNISEGLKGRKLSEEHKRKIGIKSIGRKWDERRRERILRTKRNKRYKAIGGRDNIQDVIDRFNNGDSIYSIYKHYNTSVEVIIRILMDEGIDARAIRNTPDVD